MYAVQHPANYVLKSRSTGKFLASCPSGFFLTYRPDEAEHFCECCAPDIAGVAAKIFDMGFRVVEALPDSRTATHIGHGSFQTQQPIPSH